MKKYYCLLLITTLIGGCVSAGREVTQKDMAGIEKGKTTTVDVKSRLGKPNSQTIDSEGRQIYTYFFIHSQARPESFIPIVGAFVGGADTRNSYTTFIFDSEGILQSYTQSEGGIGAGQNMSSTGYQAEDRQEPKASQ